MRKYLKFLFLIFTVILMAGCENAKTSSFRMGNPYLKEFAGLKGPVKYAVYSYYKHGYVAKATRMDYSTDGTLTQQKTYEKNDSVVLNYIYDPNNNIQEVTGTGICSYKNRYKNGNLAKEWFYTSKNKKRGYTLRYKVSEEKLVKKENDIRTGAGITTSYTYYNDGVVLEKQRMQNNGAYEVNIYDDEGHLIEIVHYSPDSQLLYREKITCKYDDYGNCVNYVARRKGKIVDRYKVSIKYYTEDELSSAKNTVDLFHVGSIDDDSSSQSEPPALALLITIAVLIVLLFSLYIFWLNKYVHLFSNPLGVTGRNGMRKMWMYNSEPYTKMSLLFLAAAGSFLSSILFLLLFGGITWMLFSLVKLMLLSIIIVGWLMAAIGILLMVVKSKKGFPLLAVGMVVIAFRDKLEYFGGKFADWGGEFLDNVNALDWTMSILRTYGGDVLLVVAVPMLAFLLLAGLLIFISGMLRLLEFVSIKTYNVHRPCPYCGNNSQFVYMVGGEEYPVPLHPGLYGVLHQTNHHTGVRVPTMLLNGKAKLVRRCLHCKKLVNTTRENVYGTDVHIGIVGARSSGKTYMLFSALEKMKERWGDDFYQADVDNNKLEDMMSRIHQREGVQTAVKNRYKAIQFCLDRKLRPLPYHLFFYDVAGEKFRADAVKTLSALEFYTNVKVIAFVVDPTIVDIRKGSPSADFAQWYRRYGNPDEVYDLEAVISSLQEIIEQIGRKTQDIDLVVTCTKKDLGYLQNSGYPYDAAELQIKQFINEELGLYNLDNAANNLFKSVGYAAVSVMDDDCPALNELFVRLLKQGGVSHID